MHYNKPKQYTKQFTRKDKNKNTFLTNCRIRGKFNDNSIGYAINAIINYRL